MKKFDLKKTVAKAKSLDYKKLARDFVYGKPADERRLGDLYMDKTGLYKHREWRGIKDTFYYFNKVWLYNYGMMVYDVMRYGGIVTFAKGCWRYRWMGQTYLPVLHWFDRGMEGLRGEALRACPQHYRAMGAREIRGVRRTKKPADPAFDGVYTHDELDGLLPDTDILVMALPSTPDTVGILSRQRIALLPETAYVVNVGRGTAIDQPALVEAPNAGRLAGAALDVFAREPIPDGDPVWEARNLLITPHISGQMSLGYTRDKNVALFCEDLENYAAGRPLARFVDRRVGY